MKITAVGIDLAKNVFAIHGVNERGKVMVRKQLKRGEVAKFFANLPPCLIGMEACASAHYWARKLMAFGHTVKLMAPQFVKPYVKTNKSDARDAEAICEAVQRPNMRFVPVKTPEQQAVLALHRARQGFVKARTGQANQLRGLLAEFGIVIARGIAQLPKRMPEILEDGENGLPGQARQLFAGLWEHFLELDRRVAELERDIVLWHRNNEPSRKLEKIAGIGPITASALVASIGDARTLHSARQAAAWVGLVPRQHSSGGKDRLLGISKRGDVYLRTLLIHGARSVVSRVEAQADRGNGWLKALLNRRNKNVAAVALANKNVRIAWALLAKDRAYQADYAPSAKAAQA
jgi:transposase